jgi:hypothetical protein
MSLLLPLPACSFAHSPCRPAPAPSPLPYTALPPPHSLYLPASSVTLLLRNEHLKNLLDNDGLMVMDPLDGNKIHHYQQNLNWDSTSQK